VRTRIIMNFSKLPCGHFITVIIGHDGLGKPFSITGIESLLGAFNNSALA